MNGQFFFVAPVVLLLISLKSYEAVQVTIKQGILEGTVSTSRNGSVFYSFYGIPFAKPPVGKLRFEAPKEPDNWMGVRESKTPPHVCLKVRHCDLYYKDTEGREDCLYLNVFTPGVASSSSLPVMVFMNNDEFSCGNSSMYGPEYFMDHRVVVVTVQYRIGLFGFFTALDEVLPGNYGLKDQVAALKWVQENIIAFGGDRKRVTIVGHGGGAGSVSLHMYSPLSTGLFHRAIIQSGSALAPWALADSKATEDLPNVVLVNARCPVYYKISETIYSRESKLFVECLRKVPAKWIINFSKNFYIHDVNPVIPFPPVVEPKNMSDAFLTENPWRLQVINSVPVMIGVTADDGLILSSRLSSSPYKREAWTSHYDYLLPMALFYSHVEDSIKSNITKAIKNYYFGDNDISLKTRENFREMFTDGLFAATSLEAARRINNTVYFYLYDHQNEHSFSELENVTDEREVSHGDDLISLFNLTEIFPPVKKESTTDYAVSERMVKYWINFVQNGDPNGERKVWSPFRSDNFAYLHIKTESDDMEENLRLNNYIFWRDNFFPILQIKSQDWSP